MENYVSTFTQAAKQIAVSHIAGDELHGRQNRRDVSDTTSGQVVDSTYVMSGFNKGTCQGRSNKTSNASNQYFRHKSLTKLSCGAQFLNLGPDNIRLIQSCGCISCIDYELRFADDARVVVIGVVG